MMGHVIAAVLLVVFLGLAGIGAWRAWSRMPTTKTPSPYRRSQDLNRRSAELYALRRGHVAGVKFQRRHHYGSRGSSPE